MGKAEKEAKAFEGKGQTKAEAQTDNQNRRFGFSSRATTTTTTAEDDSRCLCCSLISPIVLLQSIQCWSCFLKRNESDEEDNDMHDNSSLDNNSDSDNEHMNENGSCPPLPTIIIISIVLPPTLPTLIDWHTQWSQNCERNQKSTWPIDSQWGQRRRVLWKVSTAAKETRKSRTEKAHKPPGLLSTFSKCMYDKHVASFYFLFIWRHMTKNTDSHLTRTVSSCFLNQESRITFVLHI